MTDNFEDQYTVEELEPQPEGSGVTIDDFVAYMPQHSYIFTPCREPWPAASIDGRLPRMPVLDEQGRPMQRNGNPVTISASRWLDQNAAVEQMIWLPGRPKLVKDQLVVDGGFIEREGVTIFNQYRPPTLEFGDDQKAGLWIEHVERVFSDEDAHHIIKWLAHRVQLPHEKINHALVLGGAPGIGKDSMLEPVKYAVGHWNFKEVSPQHLLGNFNDFARCVILRINEARDVGEYDRFKLYDHLKGYTVTPPDTVRVNEKYIREQYIFNCMGVIQTTNHKTDGIYLPAEDRRNYVAWSERKKEDFPDRYWNTLWGYYRDGGLGHVAAFLNSFDLSDFDPKAAPPKTPAFWHIVGANTPPEDAGLADVVDALGNPDALTLKQLIAAATGETAEWLMDRKNRRSIPHRLERCGYVSVRNPNAKDGIWKIKGERQVIYAKASLPAAEAIGAAYKRAQHD
jgi:Family of unknown function (DUF5906)